MTKRRLFAREALRPFYFAAGLFLLVVGVAGVFLPLIPGTLLLIIATACFARSSPRFEIWLLSHPRFGPDIKRWQKNCSIPVRAKVVAVSAMAISFILLWMSTVPLIALWLTAVGMSASALYVVTRPSA